MVICMKEIFMCNLVGSQVYHRSDGMINSGFFLNMFFIHHGRLLPVMGHNHCPMNRFLCNFIQNHDDWIANSFPMSLADRNSSADSDGVGWQRESSHDIRSRATTVLIFLITLCKTRDGAFTSILPHPREIIQQWIARWSFRFWRASIPPSLQPELCGMPP